VGEQAPPSLLAHLRAETDDLAGQDALLEALREPVLITSDQGRITRCNRAALEWFGGTLQPVGCPIEEVLPFVAGQRAARTDAWQGQVVDATGRTRVVEVQRTTLRQGQSVGAVYILHDVTRHVERQKFQEQLLYDIAHELRAPLTILEISLEIAATEYETLTAREFEELLGRARRTATRIHHLMDGLLSAGSIQAGRFVLTPLPTPLRDLVEEAREAVLLLASRRGQQIDLALPDADVEVMADQRYAVQLLANLLDNASKYSPDRARICIRAERQGKFVRVAVVDRGAGIPAEQQAALFERYFRIHHGGDQPGVGLGLGIARDIAEAHGGRIGMLSELGAGTEVWFTLPVSEPRAARSRPAHRRPSREPTWALPRSAASA
jgi:signal transduction histidine kinase